MSFRAIFLVLSLLMGPASFGIAEPQSHPRIGNTGNEFQEVCRHTDDEQFQSTYASDVFTCLGFTSGFIQGVYVSDEFHSSPQTLRMTCTPDEVTTGQFVRIIKKYIDEHPERAHMATRYLASEALIRAFPCKK